MRARATPSRREWRELTLLRSDLVAWRERALASEAELQQLQMELRTLGSAAIAMGESAIRLAVESSESRPAILPLPRS